MAQSKLVFPVQAVFGTTKPGTLEIGTDWEKSGTANTAMNNNPSE